MSAYDHGEHAPNDASSSSGNIAMSPKKGAMSVAVPWRLLFLLLAKARAEAHHHSPSNLYVHGRTALSILERWVRLHP